MDRWPFCPLELASAGSSSLCRLRVALSSSRLVALLNYDDDVAFFSLGWWCLVIGRKAISASADILKVTIGPTASFHGINSCILLVYNRVKCMVGL